MAHFRLRLATLAISAQLFVGAPAFAADPLPPPAPPASTIVQPDDARLTSHGHYVNKDGHVVHAPAQTVDGKPPAGATARCGDGSYSFSQHRSGTCSHHGGVGA